MLLTNLLLRRPLQRTLGIRLQTTQLRLLAALLLLGAVASTFIALVVGDVARPGRRHDVFGLRLRRGRLARGVGGVGVGHCCCCWIGTGWWLGFWGGGSGGGGGNCGRLLRGLDGGGN